MRKYEIKYQYEGKEYTTFEYPQKDKEGHLPEETSF